MNVCYIDRFCMFHNWKNKIKQIFFVFQIVKKIILRRKKLQSEKNQSLEFFNQSIASFFDFDVQQSKCFFFEIAKIFDVSNLNCFFQTVKQIESNLFDRIHINSIFNFFDEKINVFIINISFYLNHIVRIIWFIQNKIEKFNILRLKRFFSVVIAEIII